MILSRTAEMASAGSQCGVLHGAAAVELGAIDPATASGYLERVQVDPPPRGWRDLVGRLRASPASPLAEALNNPLALTLIRDTYQCGDDARELLDHCDAIQQRASGAQAAEEITDHLLDRVLPAAYASRPGQPPPRYDLQTAQNALAKIAVRMNEDGTRDLPWWHIPRWVSSVPRITAGGLVAGLAAGLAAGLVPWLMYSQDDAIQVGGPIAVLAGVAAGVAARGTSGQPARIGRIGRPRLRQAFTKRTFRFGLAAGIAAGLLLTVLFEFLDVLSGIGLPGMFVFVNDVKRGLLLGLVFGVVSTLAVGLANAFVDPDSTSSPSPATSWHNDRKHSMRIGLVAGLVLGFVFTLAEGLQGGLASGLVFGLVSGLVVGLVSGFAAGISISHAWPTALAVAQLARRWHTPLHLMNFLNDARERNVLRTVGPLYQFRHARLQDRLAASAPAAASKRSQRAASRRPVPVPGGQVLLMGEQVRKSPL